MSFAPIAAPGTPTGRRNRRRTPEESRQIAVVADTARRLLGSRPPFERPMVSRYGVREEARRARSVLRAAIKDQQEPERR